MGTTILPWILKCCLHKSGQEKTKWIPTLTIMLEDRNYLYNFQDGVTFCPCCGQYRWWFPNYFWCPLGLFWHQSKWGLETPWCKETLNRLEDSWDAISKSHWTIVYADSLQHMFSLLLEYAMPNWSVQENKHNNTNPKLRHVNCVVWTHSYKTLSKTWLAWGDSCPPKSQTTNITQSALPYLLYFIMT